MIDRSYHTVCTPLPLKLTLTLLMAAGGEKVRLGLIDSGTVCTRVCFHSSVCVCAESSPVI